MANVLTVDATPELDRLHVVHAPAVRPTVNSDLANGTNFAPR